MDTYLRSLPPSPSSYHRQVPFTSSPSLASHIFPLYALLAALHRWLRICNSLPAYTLRLFILTCPVHKRLSSSAVIIRAPLYHLMFDVTKPLRLYIECSHSTHRLEIYPVSRS